MLLISSSTSPINWLTHMRLQRVSFVGCHSDESETSEINKLLVKLITTRHLVPTTPMLHTIVDDHFDRHFKVRHSNPSCRPLTLAEYEVTVAWPHVKEGRYADERPGMGRSAQRSRARDVCRECTQASCNQGSEERCKGTFDRRATTLLTLLAQSHRARKDHQGGFLIPGSLNCG